MKAVLKFLFVCLLIGSFASCSKTPKDFVKVTGGKIGPEVWESFVELGLENPGSNFSVEVSDFYISKYEVTQKLYKEVVEADPDVNSTPAYFSKDPVEGEVQELRPVERISWYDCLYFCNKLSEKEGLDPVYTIENISRYQKDKAIKNATVAADYSKNGYRLPTCAEWVFAATGGTKFAGNIKFSGSEKLDEIAWTEDNSKEVSHQVGKKKANELGIYDMTGNVAEWCWDYLWKEDEFEDQAYLNYTGPEKGRYRFIKGGCFVNESAGSYFPLDNNEIFGGIQGLRYYNTGFRIVRNIE